MEFSRSRRGNCRQGCGSSCALIDPSCHHVPPCFIPSCSRGLNPSAEPVLADLLAIYLSRVRDPRPCRLHIDANHDPVPSATVRACGLSIARSICTRISALRLPRDDTIRSSTVTLPTESPRARFPRPSGYAVRRQGRLRLNAETRVEQPSQIPPAFARWRSARIAFRLRFSQRPLHRHVVEFLTGPPRYDQRRRGTASRAASERPAPPVARDSDVRRTGAPRSSKPITVALWRAIRSASLRRRKVDEQLHPPISRSARSRRDNVPRRGPPPHGSGRSRRKTPATVSRAWRGRRREIAP